MQVIYSCLVVIFFIIGTGFGYVIGKNGFVQIGRVEKPKVEEKKKKTVEEQVEEMMQYDGKNRKDKEWPV